MTTPEKVAVVVDADLPAGLALNTVAALALSVGRFVDDVLGTEVKDADGFVHTPITKLPVPILKATAPLFADVLARAAAAPDVFVVDFTRTAQTSRSYDEYAERTATVATADLDYVGIALAGPRKAVDKVVGSLPLYR